MGSVSIQQIEKWLDLLEESFHAQPIGRTDSASLFSLPVPKLNSPRWVERKLSREQVHLMIGGHGVDLRSEDRFTLRLLQTLLGGQSGRLFIELREKKSLAYTVSPLSFEGLETGYVGSYIACSPEKVQESKEGIGEVLSNLAKKGPSESEMKRAREFYLGRKAMDLQSDPSIASHYGLMNLYGIDLEESFQLEKKLNQISKKKIQTVCEKFLVNAPMVTSQVG